jgi:hypothetical protein
MGANRLGSRDQQAPPHHSPTPSQGSETKQTNATTWASRAELSIAVPQLDPNRLLFPARGPLARSMAWWRSRHSRTRDIYLHSLHIFSRSLFTCAELLATVPTCTSRAYPPFQVTLVDFFSSRCPIACIPFPLAKRALTREDNFKKRRGWDLHIDRSRIEQWSPV